MSSPLVAIIVAVAVTSAATCVGLGKKEEAGQSQNEN